VRWILAGAGALVAAFVIAAIATMPSTDKAASTPATQVPVATPVASPNSSGPEQLSLGQTASITQEGSEAATVTVSRVRLTGQPADPQFGSAPQHGDFAIVSVQVQTRASFTGGFNINPLDFYVLAAGGTHYDEGNGNAYNALATPDAELSASTLAAGENVAGKIVFDVPAGHGRIVYAPNFDGQPVAEWSY
jgi:hypothetical protein